MAADGSKLEVAGVQRNSVVYWGWTDAAGQGGMIWALTIAGLMTTVVAAGMAELASAYPVSGAQYYWSFMVARDDYKAFTSYITAWLTVIGWWFASAAVANFVASTILDIIVAWTPDFEPQSWQKYLIYVCLIWIAALANIFLSNWIPRYNKMTFVLAIMSLSSTCITLLTIMNKPPQRHEPCGPLLGTGVLPYSQYWDAIHPVAEVPVNAILLSASFISIYGLLFLGSSTAFSAMVSAAIIFVQTSIVLPQAVLLFRGRDQVLPPRYMNLGKFGVVVNALAVSWVVFLNVIYCFPTRMPVSGKNMNYVSIVCAGMMAFILLLWFTTKKKTFMGPTIDIKALHARREEGMQTELTIINAGHTSDSTIVEEESISEKKDKEELGIKISHTAINRRLS
uniref:Amino acid permease/ SLC12A domain-containing protein n=1 Tax=Bionectria ochroleuca TaxID=29856 RepID=A0A8H7N8L0_BIOOC